MYLDVGANRPSRIAECVRTDVYPISELKRNSDLDSLAEGLVVGEGQAYLPKCKGLAQDL